MSSPPPARAGCTGSARTRTGWPCWRWPSASAERVRPVPRIRWIRLDRAVSLFDTGPRGVRLSRTPDPSGRALPRIVVPPPGPVSRGLAARSARVEPAPVAGILDGEPPIAWAAARGANVVDADGNVYVDFTGGFGAALVGHRNPRVVAAVEKAAGRLLHALGDAAPHADRVALAETLSREGPVRGGRVFFAASGAEAVDLALKTARLATGRTGVVAFHQGYHGTGLGALRATGRPAFRAPFEDALAPATLRVPFPDDYRSPYRLRGPENGRAALDTALAEVDAWNADPTKARLGAWVVEPVVGREGVLVPPKGWLAALGRAARDRGIVVVADEILTGGGRTGRMWASGPLEPDLVTVGKGITGGLPIAALVGRAELMAAWDAPGEARHTTTFLAHPLAVAGARAALAEIGQRDLPARARAIGARLRKGLRAVARRHRAVGDVRGTGALWGVDIVADPVTAAPDPAAAKTVSRDLAARGYLALAGGPAGSVLSLTPPLVITDRQIDGFLAALDGALDRAQRI
ncbi:MAG TPA: aminotransferase class III-fold pyridoxal phosphate-dependent enzyme [Gemmatimonadota bacterium]|nr:aminotransferase class III-fold pyridoxal phosphate-dependent enzyme [Gemmatimonadota bacterium]